MSGGWTGPDTFTADLLFLETPHRLSLTCSLRDRGLDGRWHTAALRGESLRSHGVPDQSLSDGG